MRYILFRFLFFTLEVLQAQTYPSLSELKQQQATLQQQQLEDSLLQMGEVPQLLPFVEGRVVVSKAHNFNQQVENKSWSTTPYLTTGLRLPLQTMGVINSNILEQTKEYKN